MAIRRVALIASAVLLVAGWLPAREGVWTWVKDPVECPELNGALYMAYDESCRQPALLVVHYLTDEPWYHALFHYDGRQWNKTWEGNVDNQYWAAPIGFYYDPEIGRLAYIALVTTGFEQGHIGIYRYQEGAGWSLAASRGGMGPRSNSPGVAYDTRRKLVVIAGLHEKYQDQPLTVEFDGQNFVQKPMPEGISLEFGRIGYDPEAHQTIFFGQNIESEKINETFAYDGNTWTKVQTTAHPPQINYSIISGMLYHPLLHGLVAITSDFLSSETWLYLNGDWQKINVLEQSSARIDPAVGCMPDNEAILLTGGTARTGRTISTDWAFDTWQLRRVLHSKPASNPSKK